MEILLQRVDEAREHRFRIKAFAVHTRRKRSASPVMASSHFERRRRSSPPVFDPSSSESLLLQNASIKALLSSTVSRVGSNRGARKANTGLVDAPEQATAKSTSLLNQGLAGSV
jgi:hypothetical protein